MILRYNPAFTEIIRADQGERSVLETILCLEDPDKGNSREYQAGEWDGVHRFFLDEEMRLFPTGLLLDVLGSFEEQGMPFELQDPPSRNGQACPVVASDLLKGILLRDYQKSAVEAVLRFKRGVVKIAPRGGKTEIQAGVIKSLGLPSLLLVDSARLLEQHHERLLERGVSDVGRLGSDHRELGSKHLVATVQSVYSGIKRKDREIRSMLDSVGLIQGDEIHHLSNNRSWYTPFMSCRGAEYRVGYSGTPLRSRPGEADPSDIWLKGATGRIIVDVSSKELRDKGYLVEPILYMIRVVEPKMWHMRHYASLYKKGIAENDFRNATIAELVMGLYLRGRSTLVLTRLISHGEDLLRRMGDLSVPSIFFRGGGNVGVIDSEGKVKTVELSGSRISNLLKEGKMRCILSSTVFDEGVDLPLVDTVVIAAGGKSYGRTLQRAFRGMTAVTGKSEAKIFDFYDHTNFILRSHSKQRMRDYKSEEIKVVETSFEDLKKRLRI